MAESQQWTETGVGAAVILAAAGFLIYALSHAATSAGGGGVYTVDAKFGQVGSLAAGSDVRVAGVKVGAVSTITLDPKTFLAKVDIQINKSVKLPSDSSVKITSDSLLGGQHVAIEPGGSTQDLKPGDEFQNVQGAVDLFGLIGQVIRPSGGDSSSATPGAAPTAPATAKKPAADPYPGD